MPIKSYTVIIQIDFNTIDCPGVWLCPKGKAFLKICLFGIADLTKDVDPFFPLVIRERFIFEKNFIDVSSVYELHDKIGRSVIGIELLQCPVGSQGCVKLAVFNSLLSDLLHPYSSCFARPPDTSGIELLFTTCKIFPGIIAPKADIALKVVVSDSHGDEGKPSVRRMPLKSRKGQTSSRGDSKRQQAVCHSKNGLNCGCFSHDRAQPREQDQPDSSEGGDGFRTEPTAGQNAAYMPSTDKRPKISQFYPKPPPTLTPDFSGHQGQYRKSTLQKPIQRFLTGIKKSQLTQKDNECVEEPDMEWARLNFGVAVGPGEYQSDDKDQRTMFSKGWEYVWDGEKGNKTGKRQTILSARRPVFRAIEQNDDILGDPISDEDDEYYGDDAIRREMDECKKLLHKYKADGVRNDPELRNKYDNCEKNIEWLRKYGDKSHSSDKLINPASKEEVFQSTAPRQPTIVPCHGKCCKCKEGEKGTGEELSMEGEGETFRTPRKDTRKPSRNPERLSPIDENSEWFPRKQWEKQQQHEVRHRKERFWERERIIQEHDQRSQQAQENDESEEPRPNDKEKQERRTREQERRRQQEPIRQREVRERRDRKSRQQRDSSSDLDKSIESLLNGDTDIRGRPSSEAARREPPRAERQLYSPEKLPKPSTDAAKPSRPSTTPYSGKRQDQPIPGRATKTKPTLPQQPNSTVVRKPQSVPQRALSPRKSRPDGGDLPEEDCDCDLCERYQELYNPISHPCPRFRKSAKNNNRQTPPKNTGMATRKMIASRKNANGRTKKPDRRNGECSFFSCDGPIDTEAIEEMNAIQKFYYGK